MRGPRYENGAGRFAARGRREQESSPIVVAKGIERHRGSAITAARQACLDRSGSTELLRTIRKVQSVEALDERGCATCCFRFCNRKQCSTRAINDWRAGDTDIRSDVAGPYIV